MTEETTNLVLEHLRHIRARVDGLTEDTRQVILRLGAVERHVAGFHISDVSQNAAIDALRERLERVERRLELSDTSADGGARRIVSRMMWSRDAVRLGKPCPNADGCQ